MVSRERLGSDPYVVLAIDPHDGMAGFDTKLSTTGSGDKLKLYYTYGIADYGNRFTLSPGER
jgi:hypothetical protein